MMRRAVPLVVLTLMSGCTLDAFRSKPLEASSKSTPAPDVGAPPQLGFAPALGVHLAEMTRTPTGLYWKDVVVGTGPEAVVGSTAVVDYTGWLSDGRKFQSSKDAGKTYRFVVGQGMVIAGWDQGVAGMRAGGRRMLVIPPDLGYGASGAGGLIPPNATVVFEVDLRDVPGQATSAAAPAPR